MEQRLLRTVNRDPSHWRDSKVTFYRVTGSIDPSEIVTGNVYIHVTDAIANLEDKDATVKPEPEIPMKDNI